MVKWGNAPANGARDCFCPWLEMSRPADGEELKNLAG